jgi:hypothetical protein
VVHSIADITFRAAQIRSAQALPNSYIQNLQAISRDHGSFTEPITVEKDASVGVDVPPEIVDSEASVVHEYTRTLDGHQDSIPSPVLCDANKVLRCFCAAMHSVVHH